MKYKLNKEQQLNCDINTAWEFFSSPGNLSKITPKNLGFVALTNIKNKPIYVGMEIDYMVSPLLKIPLKWKTKITNVDFHHSFTDLQVKGPYKYWNHSHIFIQNNDGVLMKDNVDYELPLGLIGSLANVLFIKKKLEYIFNYRFAVLEKLFNHKIIST